MKKKIKVSSILMVLVPFLLCLLLQVMVGIAGGVILGVRFSAEWIQDNLIYILVATHLMMAGIFGFWYWNVCEKRRDSKIRDAITIKSIATIILYSVGLIILISVVYFFVDLADASILDDYANLLETAGIGSGIWSVIATVLLAPIGEECVFRGLTLFYLEKTEAKFWVANIIQALLFGIMHGNIVQGTYAFFLGLFLGQIVNKYKSIIVGIIFHMLFNLLGSSAVVVVPTNSVVSSLLCAAVGAVLVVVGFIICKNDVARERRTEKRVTSLSYYKAYTPKHYRTVVHFILPIVFTLLGTLLIQVEEIQGTMIAVVTAVFLVMECSGEYIAFGATCEKNVSPLNWVKSSHKGKMFFRKIYLWDVVIRFIKYTIVWVILGIIPVMCGNWSLAVVGYLITMVDSLIAANFIRRIDNVQLLAMIMLPVQALSALVFTLIIKYDFMSIPVSVILFIFMIVGMVLTYKLSIGAYEKSFNDAK